jgi:monofunctional glycosyltransferase
MATNADPRVDPAPVAPVRRRWSIGRVLKWVFSLLLLCLVALLGLIVAYRVITPPVTATILGQRLSGQQITQRWVPIERMSQSLILAVISSEDSGFCRHRGVDWRELADVVESARDGTAARGGSTIPMQTVKNLFLWNSKSYVRKAIEIPITLAADPIWGKRRTLEIYLNIAEWGPGVFGAEAAAQYHFKKSAARLSEMEAALLAAALPSPIARDSGDPGAQQQRLAQRLVERMRQAPAARLACLNP